MGIFSKKKTEDKEVKQVKKTDEVKVVTKKEVKKAKKEVIKKTHGNAYKNLVRPIITEKASYLGMNNQYVFEVAVKANKVELKNQLNHYMVCHQLR